MYLRLFWRVRLFSNIWIEKLVLGSSVIANINTCGAKAGHVSHVESSGPYPTLHLSLWGGNWIHFRNQIALMLIMNSHELLHIYGFYYLISKLRIIISSSILIWALKRVCEAKAMGHHIGLSSSVFFRHSKLDTFLKWAYPVLWILYHLCPIPMTQIRSIGAIPNSPFSLSCHIWSNLSKLSL